MSSPEQAKALADNVAASLNRILDQIKFGEAKNAALLTFASAWILALVNLLSQGRTLPYGLDLGCRLAIASLTVAAVFAIVSFLPRHLDFFHRDPEGARNLLYFEHIAPLELATFRQRIKDRFAPDDDTVTTANYIDDLAHQVLVTSRIATRKFRLFSRGAYFVLLAVPCLIFPLSFPIIVGAADTVIPLLKGPQP